MSIFIDITSDFPLQISWVCQWCKQMGTPLVTRDLRLEVPGSLRVEKLANIHDIINDLARHDRKPHQLDTLNSLLHIAVAEGIRITYMALTSALTVPGLYTHLDGVPCIILDETLKTNPAEHVAVLAEEVGRYFASHKQDDEAKQQVFALRWAVKFLTAIPCNSRVAC